MSDLSDSWFLDIDAVARNNTIWFVGYAEERGERPSPSNDKPLLDKIVGRVYVTPKDCSIPDEKEAWRTPQVGTRILSSYPSSIAVADENREKAQNIFDAFCYALDTNSGQVGAGFEKMFTCNGQTFYSYSSGDIQGTVRYAHFRLDAGGTPPVTPPVTSSVTSSVASSVTPPVTSSVTSSRTSGTTIPSGTPPVGGSRKRRAASKPAPKRRA
jgi:hypothetical protein